MVADLAQLHQYIILKQTLNDARTLPHEVCGLQKMLVELQLHVGKTDADVDFNLVRKLLYTVGFGSSQHKWLEDAMQDLNDKHLLLFRNYTSLLFTVKVEPVVEVRCIFEKFWHHEV